MTTLYYSKLFTGGLLDGLTYTGAMEFVSEAAAIEWAKAAEKGIEQPIASSPYRVTSWNLYPNLSAV